MSVNNWQLILHKVCQPLKAYYILLEHKVILSRLWGHVPGNASFNICNKELGENKLIWPHKNEL
jgi:hypothetical protein